MGGETLIMDTGVMSWHTISSPACESAASQVGKSVGGSGRVGVGGGKSGGSNSGNPPSPLDDRAPMQGTGGKMGGRGRGRGGEGGEGQVSGQL